MSKVAYVNGNVNYIWWYCAGCKTRHSIPINRTDGHNWEFNGNMDKPSVTPSVLNRWGKDADPAWEEPIQEPNEATIDPDFTWSGRCHIFITNGLVQFLSDCTHKLAGQTLELPELE